MIVLLWCAVVMVIRHIGYKQQKAARCLVWSDRLVCRRGAQLIYSRKLCTPLERHKLITADALAGLHREAFDVAKSAVKRIIKKRR